MENKNIKKPTGFSKDSSDNIIISYEFISPESIEKMSSDRLLICMACQNYIEDRCKLCGCGMHYKSALIYPLDDNGKAYNRKKPNGELGYVCLLKKW